MKTDAQQFTESIEKLNDLADKEWNDFCKRCGTVEWDSMSEQQRDEACRIAEMQGARTRKVLCKHGAS